MKKYIAAVGATIALAGGAAACGSSTSNDTGDKISEVADKEDAPTAEKEQAEGHGDGDAVAEQAAEAPTLDVGETVRVDISAEDFLTETPAGSADVTLVSLTEAPDSDFAGEVRSELEPGEEYVIATYKVENTGDGKLNLMPLREPAEWNGKDGEYATPGLAYLSETGTSRVPHDPLPETLPKGGHTQGTQIFSVPAEQPGTLGFQDSEGIPIFNINTKGAK